MRSGPTTEDDRQLVADVLNREPGAFERLVTSFQGLCWHIVSRMVRDREDARDLCQETFLRVHRHLHQYLFESPLRAWIGQVAYSTALRHLERKRVPLVALSDDDEMPIPDLARMTGIAEGTIKSHLFRSRAKLREQLETFVRA